jgi:hypothetical protein
VLLAASGSAPTDGVGDFGLHREKGTTAPRAARATMKHDCRAARFAQKEQSALKGGRGGQRRFGLRVHSRSNKFHDG